MNGDNASSSAADGGNPESGASQFDRMLSSVEDWVRSDVLTWALLIETAFLLVVAMLALGVQRAAVPRLDALLGGDALPRVLRAPMKRLLPVIGAAVAAVGAWVGYGLAQATGIDGELLRIAGNLLTAWVIIRIVASFLHRKAWAALIAGIVWIGAALAILGWLETVHGLLDAAQFRAGDLRISLLGIINGLVLLALFLWLGGILARIFDERMTRLEGVSPAARVLIVKVTKIVFYVVAFIVALTSIGIDLTAVAVFSGALGVGLGFGLQKVVSNLLSGIILLMDRSLKPGDVIEIGDAYGWIEKMGARYLTVVTRDGKEYLIPNEDIITRQVINWSYSDTAVRLKIGVGISYRSDVRKAMNLMLEAARGEKRVLRSEGHEPQVRLVDFGNSSVDLELRIWVSDPQAGLVNITSDIRLAIWDAFHDNGIEFPFPQRDLHIVSAEGLRNMAGPGPGV